MYAPAAVLTVGELEGQVRRGCARLQGLTLVHLSAQPEPFLVAEPLKLSSVSLKSFLR